MLLAKGDIVVRKRVAILFFAIFFIFGLLCLRLVWLQLIQGTWYQQQALQNRIREIAIDPKRGDIYDRNGNVLATSISADAVYAIPAEVKSSGRAPEIARDLAGVLGMKESEMLQRITMNQQSVWVKLKLDPGQSQALRQLRLPGIGIVTKPQRYYPQKNLACHVLGIAGDYNQGLEGLEVAYDKELSGISGRMLVECDAQGREIPDTAHQFIEPEPGLSLVLTIDQNIQYFAERELDKVVQERHPKSASIIIMDPDTGEILALANRPDFDPNNYADYPDANRRNAAISNSYEPGSTFKIVTLGAGLDENLVSENDRFYCPGYIKVADRTIHCWLPEGHGSESLAEVVQNSCNPGFITIGLRIGLDKFYKYLDAFGFGQPLGIDLPGEASGIIVNEKDATQVDLATMSIGQANSVTPLQLVTAMSAVANGGKLMRPYLVKEMLNSQGQVVKQFQPRVIRQVISGDTSREEASLLQRVVDQGTGSNARIDGYTVAGKTGTGQKPLPGGGYSETDHVLSFCGFAPVDQPRLACVVMLDTPQGYPQFGGVMAAPVFQGTMRDSLRYLRVPLRYVPNGVNLNSEMTVVPPVINLPLQEAQKVLAQAGLEGVPNGRGAVVLGQVPVDGVSVKKGSQVLLNLSAPNGTPTGERTVPDVRGKSLRDTAELLGYIDLELAPQGVPQGGQYPTGNAVEQDPPAGTRVKAGTRVTVTFAPPLPMTSGP
jgi:stage V sporulation protein D (sporulation-specific penicillin-binding protein)